MTETYQNSSLCQSCGRCCREFWLYVNGDTALRFEYLNTSKVRVDHIRGDLWIATFEIPCVYFRQKPGSPTRSCTIYTRDSRPRMCSEFPLNILETGDRAMIAHCAKNCPALQELMR